MKEYEKTVGKTNEEAMRELGKAAARELAFRTHPWGLSAKVGKKLQGNIAVLAFKALKSRIGKESIKDADDATLRRMRRTSDGRVPDNLSPGKRKWFTDNEFKVAKPLVDKAVAKAGRMKMAWIAAGEKLVSGKIKGVAKWIRRHGESFGKIVIKPNPAKTAIEITNATPYLDDNHIDTQAALRVAYGKQSRRMKMEIAAKTKATI